MSELERKRSEARRLAAEMRRIIERLAIVDAPADLLATAADAASTFADQLETLLEGEPWTYEGYAETALAGSPQAFFDRSPIIGLANPIAAPVRLQVVADGDDSRVEGTAVFTAAYEGPPGSIHGGHVAAAFDEVLGMAQTLSGKVGMTGTLTVRYRLPTPLYTELRFRAWVDRVEGRKIFVKGTCRAGDDLTAEADGIFIAVDPSKFTRLLDERTRKTAEG